MNPEMLERSKTVIFLTGVYRRSRLAMGDSIKTSRVADLLSDIKRSFFNKAVKSASIFLFTAVSVNILSIAVFHREINLLDIIIKGAVLFLCLGGFFCNANWKDVKKSSVILGKIFRWSTSN